MSNLNNLLNCSDKDAMKSQFLVALIICVLTILSSSIVNAAGEEDSVLIGGKTASGFENKSCGWILKNFFNEEKKNLLTFIQNKGFLECTREDIVKRENPELYQKGTAPYANLVNKGLYKTALAMAGQKADDCWKLKEAYLKKQNELFEDFLSAMRVRVALYDAKYLYNHPVGRNLLLNSCKIVSSSSYNRDSGDTFTGRRRQSSQSDADFIRDHSVSCSNSVKIEVQISDFQKDITSKFPKYTVPQVSSSLVNYQIPQQMKEMYGNDSAFKDRQVCQQMINMQEDINEANRIKPPVTRSEEKRPPKPDACTQFENTFDCKRMEEAKEIKILIGWPMCIKDVIYDCQMKLMSEGKGPQGPERRATPAREVDSNI